jgi:serine/threonine protein kinase
MFRK